MKQTVVLSPINTSNFSTGAKVSFSLNQLVAATPPRTKNGAILRAYVRRISIVATLPLVKADAGAASLTPLAKSNWLAACRLWTTERTIVDLPTIPGKVLVQDQLVRTGNYDATIGTDTIAASTTTTVRSRLEIGYVDRRFGKFAAQFMPMAAEFKDGQLDLTWCASAVGSGRFGTNISIGAGTMVVSVDVVYLADARVPTRRTLREISPSTNTNASLDGLANTAVVDLAMHGIDADGVTQRYFTTDVTALSLKVDGGDVHVNTTPDTIVDDFNGELVDTGSRLPAYSGGLCSVLPEVYPSRGEAKLSRSPILTGAPSRTLSGSIAITSYRLGAVVLEPQTSDDAMKVARRLGLAAKVARPKIDTKADGQTALLVPLKFYG